MFPQYESLLQSAGFEDIEAYETPTPIGSWPKDKRLKEIGVYFSYQFIEFAVESYALALFTKVGHWTESETKILLSLVRNEVKSNKMHIYTHWFVKPRSCNRDLAAKYGICRLLTIEDYSSYIIAKKPTA